MNVRLSPMATKAARMIQKNGVPASGWLVGQLMGRVWLVESFIPRDWPSRNPESDLKNALEWIHADLLGVYFAHTEIPREESTKGDLMLRILPEAIDAAIFDPGDESSAEMEYHPVYLSGGMDGDGEADG